MSQSFYGSICVTDLLAWAKEKHSAFSKADNGKIYCSVNVWLNDNLDKYGNVMSIQLNPTKDKKDVEKKHYLGNMKQSERKQIGDRDVSELNVDLDDVPTRNTGTPAPNAANPQDDDLQF